MGRLNAAIKLSSNIVNFVLFLFGLGLLAAGSYVSTSDIADMGDSFISTVLPYIIASGALLVFITILGCCGTCHQTDRGGCGGRQMLSVYQLILVAVLVGQGIFELWMTRIQQNLETAAIELPADTYGTFETDYRNAFDSYYFQEQCVTSTAFGASTVGTGWLWTLVDDRCNTTMSSTQCYCETVAPNYCTSASTYDSMSCCPRQALCTAGLAEACPYDRCRSELIDYALGYISPITTYLVFVLAVEAAALVLTCLLVCYNPRDTVEDMLWKTGVLARSDDNPDVANGNGTAGAGSGNDGSAEEEVLLAPGKGKEPLSPGGTFVMDGEYIPSTPLRQFQSPRGKNEELGVTLQPAGGGGGGGSSRNSSRYYTRAANNNNDAGANNEQHLSPASSPGSHNNSGHHSPTNSQVSQRQVGSPRSPTPLLYPVKRLSGASQISQHTDHGADL